MIITLRKCSFSLGFIYSRFFVFSFSKKKLANKNQTLMDSSWSVPAVFLNSVSAIGLNAVGELFSHPSNFTLLKECDVIRTSFTVTVPLRSIKSSCGYIPVVVQNFRRSLFGGLLHGVKPYLLKMSWTLKLWSYEVHEITSISIQIFLQYVFVLLQNCYYIDTFVASLNKKQTIMAEIAKDSLAFLTQFIFDTVKDPNIIVGLLF